MVNEVFGHYLILTIYKKTLPKKKEKEKEKYFTQHFLKPSINKQMQLVYK